MVDDNIDWVLNYEIALQTAKKQHKPILLQFHRDSCSGCRKLYALTYPDDQVKKELYEWFVPLRLDIIQDRTIRSQYSAYWTPSFFFLDHAGRMYVSFNGFLNPEDFRVQLRLAYAAYLIPRGKYRETIDLMEDGLRLFPDNPRSASLLFNRGMAEYLTGRDKPKFYLTMTEILDRYPDSLEASMWPWMED